MALPTTEVTADLPHMVTLAAAANTLGVSPRTVRRMIARGELKAYRYGPRLIRIDPADLHQGRARVNTLETRYGRDA